MKILLIYPEHPDTFWSFNSVLKFVRKKAAFPPLGLLTIGAMLPEEWEAKLVDMNVSELKQEDIEWSDMIFISGMIVQTKSIKQVIERCKNKKIVAGGPVFTTGYQDFEDVDHFVLDEAEITLPRFLKDLKEDNSEKIYRSEEKPDITKTPIPKWSLINFKDYNTMAVQFSRGCPFNCEFCDIIIMNGRIPRTKTPNQMVKELNSLKEAGYDRSIFIVDDNFIGNKAKVKEFLKVLIQWQKENKFYFKFLTEASVDLADDEELMNLMNKANFHKVFLGFETPESSSLKECNKLQNMNINPADAVKKINRHGMQVMGGFIVGFDSDSESIFDRQIDFIQKMGVVTAMVGLLNALPQTRLWHRLKEEGRLLREFSGENTDGKINFIPKMDKEELLKGYSKILDAIYSHKNYYRRIDTFIKNYKPTVKGGKFSFVMIYAFWKSLWKIGIFSSARFSYWKLILKTLLLKIKAFPTAVELAIYGLHFEEIAKNIREKNGCLKQGKI